MKALFKRRLLKRSESFILLVLLGFAWLLPVVVQADSGFYDVTVHGALPDDAVDDSAPLQRLIDEGIPPSGGILYFPTGTYRFDAPLVLQPNLTVRGAGKGSSTIVVEGTHSALASRHAINSSNAAHIVVEDLGFRCTNPSNTGAGMEEIGGTFVHLRRLRFEGFRYGVIFDQTELSHIDLSEFVDQVSAGLWLVNGPDYTPGAKSHFTNQITVARSRFSGNAPYGILDDGGDTHQIKDSSFDGFTNSIRLAGTHSTILSGSRFVNSSGASVFSTNIQAGGAAAGQNISLSIENNRFRPATSQPGILLYNGTPVLVTGNHFDTSVTSIRGTANAYAVISMGNETERDVALFDDRATQHIELGEAGMNASKAAASVSLETGGTLSLSIAPVKTAAYVAGGEVIVPCDPTQAGFTVTLPAASAANKGRTYVIKNVTSSRNRIVVQPLSGTIDGAANVTISTARGSLRAVSDGLAWYTF